MAKQKVENCPHCNRRAAVLPQDGGRGTGNKTAYEVICKCGLREGYFGADSGQHRVAVAQWNRWAKAEREKRKRIPGDRTP